jgi:hypothetical protein
MARIEIGDPDEVKSAARRFTDAASVPAHAAAQVARQLVLGGGPERSRLDDSMTATLDWIGEAIAAAAASRAGRADAIDAAATRAVDALVAADEDGAAQVRRAPTHLV